MPLLLVTAGLLVTFTVGLWNIGIEGQITLGAVFATWALRLLQASSMNPALVIAIAVLAGMLGGALWAMLAGALKTFGGVNEIFWRSRTQLRRDGLEPLAHIRALEAAGRRLDVGHRALP